jgi:hypothetical protein
MRSILFTIHLIPHFVSYSLLLTHLVSLVTILVLGGADSPLIPLTSSRVASALAASVSLIQALTRLSIQHNIMPNLLPFINWH